MTVQELLEKLISLSEKGDISLDDEIKIEYDGPDTYTFKDTRTIQIGKDSVIILGNN